MIKTEDRTLARRIARMELHVVLPTPPLPPTKTHLRLSCSRTFCTVPSATSDSVAAIFRARDSLLILSTNKTKSENWDLEFLGLLLNCADRTRQHPNSVYFPHFCFIFNLFIFFPCCRHAPLQAVLHYSRWAQ